MDNSVTKITDRNIRQAVDAWCRDREAARRSFGSIEEWDTSAVRNMNGLFGNRKKFNDDISRWGYHCRNKRFCINNSICPGGMFHLLVT